MSLLPARGAIGARLAGSDVCPATRRAARRRAVATGLREAAEALRRHREDVVERREDAIELVGCLAFGLRGRKVLSWP
eukprot:11177900-Lingulodinium_polyedra.AAC.1